MAAAVIVNPLRDIDLAVPSKRSRSNECKEALLVELTTETAVSQQEGSSKEQASSLEVDAAQVDRAEKTTGVVTAAPLSHAAGGGNSSSGGQSCGSCKGPSSSPSQNAAPENHKKGQQQEKSGKPTTPQGKRSTLPPSRATHKTWKPELIYSRCAQGVEYVAPGYEASSFTVNDLKLEKPGIYGRRFKGGATIESASKDRVIQDTSGRDVDIIIVSLRRGQSISVIAYLKFQWRWRAALEDLADFAAALLSNEASTDHGNEFAQDTFCAQQKLAAFSSDLRNDVDFPPPKPRALPMIVARTGGSEFEVSEAWCEELQRLHSAFLLPLIVVGTKRQGKSTLADLIGRQWALNGRQCEQLFRTSAKVKGCTRGIHVFAVPAELFVDSAPPHTLVLLLDCEGFGETRSCDGAYDTRLFAIAAGISEIIVYNTMCALDSSQIDRLATWQHLATSEFSGYTKPDLLFALRDFSLSVGEEGETSAVQYYKDCITGKKRAAGKEQVNEVQDVMQKLFENIEVLTMHRPCTEDRLAKVAELPFTDLSEDFRRDFKELANKLTTFSTNRLSRSTPTAEYNLRIMRVIAQVNESDIRPVALFSMATQLVRSTVVRKAVDEWDKNFRELVEKVPLTAASLQSVLEASTNQTLKVLQQTPTYQSSGVEERKKLEGEVTAHVKPWADVLVAENAEATLKKLQSQQDALDREKPVPEHCRLPNGDAKVMDSYCERGVAGFRAVVGDEKVIQKFIAEFENSCRTVQSGYAEYNQQYRERQKEKERALDDQHKREQEHEELIKRVRREGGDKADALSKMMEDRLKDAEESLTKQREQHEDVLNTREKDFKKVLEDLEESYKESLATRENQLKDQLEKRMKAMQNDIDKLKSDLKEKQNQIDSHKCGGCFPGGSVLTTPSGEVQMSALRVGDEVLGATGFETVLGFWDYYKSQSRDFLKIDYQSGAVHLTGNHLIKVDGNWLQAQYVQPGMRIEAQGEEEEVLAAEEVECHGIYSPATLSGTVVVDGVLCSVYAKPARFANVPVSDPTVHALCQTAVQPVVWWWRTSLRIRGSPDMQSFDGSNAASDILKILATPLHMIDYVKRLLARSCKKRSLLSEI